MNIEAHIEPRPYLSMSDQGRLLGGLRLDPIRRQPPKVPTAAPASQRLPEPLDAETVRRLHEEDPFFRARADRYNQFNAAIADVEASAEAATTARKYLEMLKRRREAVLSELVDLVAAKTPAQNATIWTAAPPAPHSVPTKPAPTRSWDWP